MKGIEQVILPGLQKVKFPQIVDVEQELFTNPLPDVEKEVREEIIKSGIAEKINKGSKVAIGVGSRGIDCLQEIVKETVNVIKEYGGNPFIIPAMGSHGGAQASGQREIIEGYGITEKEIGVPIKASMEVVKLGQTGDGVNVFFDKIAYEADLVIPINRVKVHTNFSAPHESGIMKMLTIGFGNHIGCSNVHSYGFEHFEHLIPEVADVIIEKAPIALGLGLLEDAYDKLYKVKAFNPSEIEEGERKMLKEQKKLMPQIPFKKIDILIIDELGKDISGSGIDFNVVGRVKPVYPDIKYIINLDLTDATHGNAIGIGIVDLIPKRVYEKLDFKSTYINCLTARGPEFARLPIVLKNDKEVVKMAVLLANKRKEELKLVRIKNTLALKNFQISEGLIPEAKQLENLKIKSKQKEISFTEKGQII